MSAAVTSLDSELKAVRQQADVAAAKAIARKLKESQRELAQERADKVRGERELGLLRVRVQMCTIDHLKGDERAEEELMERLKAGERPDFAQLDAEVPHDVTAAVEEMEKARAEAEETKKRLHQEVAKNNRLTAQCATHEKMSIKLRSVLSREVGPEVDLDALIASDSTASASHQQAKLRAEQVAVLKARLREQTAQNKELQSMLSASQVQTQRLRVYVEDTAGEDVAADVMGDDGNAVGVPAVEAERRRKDKEALAGLQSQLKAAEEEIRGHKEKGKALRSRYVTVVLRILPNHVFFFRISHFFLFFEFFLE